MGDLTKDMFDNGIGRIFDKLDSIDLKFEKIEQHIEKIENTINHQSERVVKVETKHDSIVSEFKEHKANDEKLHQEMFDKMRRNKQECENAIRTAIDTIPLQIESENNKQNLKIISTSVGIAGALMGFIQFIIWVFNK